MAPGGGEFALFHPVAVAKAMTEAIAGFLLDDNLLNPDMGTPLPNWYNL